MTLKNTTAILQKLRGLMKTAAPGQQPLHAYIVPTGDAHLSEYIAACDERRSYLTGFSGSAGTAIVTETEAALWTDGRYYLAAAAQLDSNWTLMKDGLLETPTQADWLSKVLPPGGRIGFDPMLLSVVVWKPMNEQLNNSGLSLVPVADNLIDKIWEDRPPCPHNPVITLATKYSGKTWQKKMTEVHKKMGDKKVTMLVLSALDDIAWLFNLRGCDIDFNPVFFSYAIVTKDESFLFMDDRQQTPEVRTHLGLTGPALEHPVSLLPYESFLPQLRLLVQKQSGKVWVSEKTTTFAVSDAVSRLGSCTSAESHPARKTPTVTSLPPVAEMKAIKNSTELQGFINCHIRDAVALCEYFCWLEKQAPTGDVTEISGADKLEKLRSQQEDYVSLSFNTISSVGSNAAVIHYHPLPETNKVINTTEIYLCDSGAQYKDGTTDVTRTMHFGTPTDYQKMCFTRVLKGHITLDTAVFPNGVNGSRIDSFARASLWQAGLDYLHGTGHGVGSFLNVHEGPCGIGFRHNPAEVPLKAGMVLSNEPGYYEDGEFGIRIENLCYVKKMETEYNFKGKGYLTFHPITMVPIQTKLIQTDLLTPAEKTWVNHFHQRCRDEVGVLLKDKNLDAYNWMMRETQPI